MGRTSRENWTETQKQDERNRKKEQKRKKKVEERQIRETILSSSPEQDNKLLDHWFPETGIPSDAELKKEAKRILEESQSESKYVLLIELAMKTSKEIWQTDRPDPKEFHGPIKVFDNSTGIFKDGAAFSRPSFTGIPLSQRNKSFLFGDIVEFLLERSAPHILGEDFAIFPSSTHDNRVHATDFVGIKLSDDLNPEIIFSLDATVNNDLEKLEGKFREFVKKIINVARQPIDYLKISGSLEEGTATTFLFKSFNSPRFIFPIDVNIFRQLAKKFFESPLDNDSYKKYCEEIRFRIVESMISQLTFYRKVLIYIRDANKLSRKDPRSNLAFPNLPLYDSLLVAYDRMDAVLLELYSSIPMESRTGRNEVTEKINSLIARFSKQLTHDFIRDLYTRVRVAY